MRTILITLLIILCGAGCFAQKNDSSATGRFSQTNFENKKAAPFEEEVADAFEQKVADAVIRQFSQYPKSRLADIYKFFFQDKFGPGHLLTDTAKAGAYLREELAGYNLADVPAGVQIDSIGWENNFVRVNLSVIKSGQISYRDFFHAFVASISNHTPDISSWQTEWEHILAVIATLKCRADSSGIVVGEGDAYLPNLLPCFEQERVTIATQLAKGNYVGHHSSVFEAAYAPHYRLISKELAQVLMRK